MKLGIIGSEIMMKLGIIGSELMMKLGIISSGRFAASEKAKDMSRHESRWVQVKGKSKTGDE
jgi:hypothetical protein